VTGDPVAWLAFACLGLGLLTPPGGAGSWLERPGDFGVGLAALAAAIWCARRRRKGLVAGLLVAGAVAIGALAPLRLVATVGAVGPQAVGFWAYLVGLAFLAWRAMALLATSASLSAPVNRLLALLVPLLFGAWLITIWQVLVVGLGVPRVLLPAPSAIAGVMAGASATMAADFYQTIIRAVIPGWLIGCGVGFVIALLVDRVPFLQRGLLPLGNFVSAIPIVGIAPIMVMWFGFDWHSKVAVVVIMTVFPMLVNTIAGLAASGAMERDLMRSYGASYLQTMVRLRLPSALPFIFNALKINSTLAMIGAIVAEFFGTPIVGMGFRISTEVGRMNIDLVWGTIVVAAVTGSLFYGLLALLERAVTFWHPSYRT
jgi:NitT/TauT family transport system permease protein